mgnify:FL=1
MKNIIKKVRFAALTSLTCMALSGPALADTVLRIAGTHAPDQYASQVLEDIKKKLEAADVGLKVKVYPASQLGSGEQLINDAIRGAVDVVHAAVYSHKDSVLDVSWLPYLASSYDEMEKLYSPGSNYYQVLDDRLDRLGLKLLGVTSEGFIGVMASKRPENVNTTGDKGLNIRVWSSQSAKAATQQMGYNTTTIDWGDAYAALQQRIVDGMIGATPEATYATFKEAIKFYIPYNAFVESTTYYASQKSWNKKFNEEQRQVIQKVFAEAASGYVDWSRENDSAYLEKLQQAGVEIIHLTDQERAQIAQEVRAGTWSLMEQRIGKEVIEKVKQDLM